MEVQAARPGLGGSEPWPSPVPALRPWRGRSPKFGSPGLSVLPWEAPRRGLLTRSGAAGKPRADKHLLPPASLCARALESRACTLRTSRLRWAEQAAPSAEEEQLRSVLKIGRNTESILMQKAVPPNEGFLPLPVTPPSSGLRMAVSGGGLDGDSCRSCDQIQIEKHLCS